jgi:propionyl-CoA carboxylase beta chain
LTESASEVDRRRWLVSDRGRPAALKRQHERGKLTARERLRRLLDVDSFQEFGLLVDAAESLAGQDLIAPADGVVTGVGHIDGRPAVVMSFDFTVFGGSNGATGGLKVARCCEHALQSGLPLVMLLDGGGHRIQEGLDSRHFAHGFPVFQQLVDLSGYVPIVAVMLGPGFAGPSNMAAFADFVVMVRGLSTMGIAGPALVRVATGEDLSMEELGGADVQAGLGVTDLAVDTETEALDAVRVILSYLPANADLPPPRDGDPPGPRVTSDISDIVPTNTKQPYDVRTVIDAIADADSVFELKAQYAPNLVACLIRLDGRPVGLLANQPLHLGGALDSPACEKGAHHISMCDAFGIPLLFLIDGPGFLVGPSSTTTQLARRSGRLMFEVGQATVPRFSLVLRKGFGAAYIAMCGGRSFAPDLAVAWPSAEICAMSVEGALDVVHRRDIESATDPAARRAELIALSRIRLDAFHGARGFGLDDVINPGETRSVLLRALERAPARRRSSAPMKRHGISPI